MIVKCSVSVPVEFGQWSAGILPFGSCRLFREGTHLVVQLNGSGRCSGDGWMVPVVADLMQCRDNAGGDGRGGCTGQPDRQPEARFVSRRDE